LGICFFLYKNLISWLKQYKLPEKYALTSDSSYASPEQDPVGSIYCHRYLYTWSIKYKQLRMYNRKVSLTYGTVITAILTGTCWHV